MKGRQRVLVVEDNFATRTMLEHTLELEGYDVLALADASTLDAHLAGQIPSLVILDVMLPGVDGFTVLKSIRASDRTRELPVLMLTALDDADSTWQGWTGGCDYYMNKSRGLLRDLLLRDRAAARDARACCVRRRARARRVGYAGRPGARAHGLGHRRGLERTASGRPDHERAWDRRQLLADRRRRSGTRAFLAHRGPVDARARLPRPRDEAAGQQLRRQPRLRVSVGSRRAAAVDRPEHRRRRHGRARRHRDRGRARPRRPRRRARELHEGNQLPRHVWSRYVRGRLGRG